MTTTLTYTGKLVQTTCYCSIALAVPEDLFGWAKRTGGGLYCPLGHSFIFKDSENARLKRDLKWAKDQAAAARARTDQAEASLRATKGHVTRLRRKVLSGECPFCGQHLRDLERHIGRQHPTETAETEEVT